MIPAQGHVPVPLGGKDSRVKNHVMRVSLVTGVSSSVFVCIMQLVVPLQVTAPVLQASKESSKCEMCLQSCCGLKSNSLAIPGAIGSYLLSHKLISDKFPCEYGYQC